MLTEMAETVGCAILGLGHLNKQTGEDPLFRIVGSIGFAASIRSALFLGTDPANRNRLALAHGKTNPSERGKTLVFELVGAGRNDVPVINPVGTSDADAAEVCKIERRNVGRPASESEEATDFVIDYLRGRDRPIRWEKIEAAAQIRSIASIGTLNNVRAELHRAGRIIQIGKGRSDKWKLGDDGEL
jgi:hypothetical protein